MFLAIAGSLTQAANSAASSGILFRRPQQHIGGSRVAVDDLAVMVVGHDLPAPAPGISGLSVGKGIFKPSPHIAVNGGINGNAGRFGAVFSASSQIRRLNASSLRTQS